MFFIIIGGLLLAVSLPILFETERSLRHAKSIGDEELLQKFKKTMKRYFLLGLVGTIAMTAPLFFMR